jgi:pimeloyl-ACP methyl ester carboxylesterase
MKLSRTRNGGLAVRLVVAVVVVLAAAAVTFAVWAYYSPLALTKWLTRRQLDQAGLERVETVAAGRRMIVWRGGQGPDLVFLHGAGHHAGGWSSIVESFVDDYTVHALDLPGHGESEPGEGPLAMAVVYKGMADYLGTLEGKPILVGNSMGAWLATLYAHRSPEHVERIVLVNGGALANVPPEGVSLTPADREQARHTMAALRDPASPPLPDNVLDDIVEQAGKGPIGRMVQDVPGLVAHLLDGRLGEVRVPVDLLWGASDQLMTVAYAERMATEFPRARLTLVEGCGHIPTYECPDRFALALRQVLDEGPPAEPAPQLVEGSAEDSGATE